LDAETSCSDGEACELAQASTKENVMDLFEECGAVFPPLSGMLAPTPEINPASGLPMLGPTFAGVDIAGNPYGMADVFGLGGGGPLGY